ncbi:MAG TPA: ornithine carbamoyltransferase [Thermoplasmata archaeon]|nr:ornithine carbamoyltransferase [Thermoplasmata archaeon]
MSTPTSKRDLLSLLDVSADIGGLLARAQTLKQARHRGQLGGTLPGKNLGLIFEKPSTRTRTSFEVGINDLGGHAIYLSSKDLQLGRGETIADTARVLSRYCDVLAYRAFRHADMLELAKWTTIPVINALDDLEHPCQIVADLLTMSERWGGSFHGHRLGWVGDGNNVLHSLLLGAAAVGLDLVAATPEAYAPHPDIVRSARELAKKSGAQLTLSHAPGDAARGADALYTDVWVSMGEESEQTAREKAFAGYQINAELLKLAKPSAFVLHDLPAHRGLEITDEVLDGPQSAAWDQAENRLHAQKAILELLVRPGGLG